MVRRDSVVRVELAELRAELDLDVFSRLGNLSKAFSHCPSQNTQPGAVQVHTLKHLCSFIDNRFIKRILISHEV